MATRQKKKVFIGYSHKNIDTVLTIERLLKRRDFTVIRDEHDFKSDEIPKEMTRNVKKSDLLLAVLSSDFYLSEWTPDELGQARALEIPIMFSAIDGTKPRGPDQFKKPLELTNIPRTKWGKLLSENILYLLRNGKTPIHRRKKWANARHRVRAAEVTVHTGQTIGIRVNDGTSRMRNSMLFSADLHFDELENPDAVQAEQRALTAANRWAESIVEKASSDITEGIIEGRGKYWRIPLREGTVMLTIPRSSRSYGKEGYYQTAYSHVQAESYDAFSRVLKEGNHSYWNIGWIIPDKIDLDSFIKTILQETGREPSSTSGTGGGQHTLTTSASYPILNYDGQRIVGTIATTAENNTLVEIACYDAGFNKGFFKAHDILSPHLVIAMLRGSIPFPKIRELVGESLMRYEASV